MTRPKKITKNGTIKFYPVKTIEILISTTSQLYEEDTFSLTVSIVTIFFFLLSIEGNWKNILSVLLDYVVEIHNPGTSLIILLEPGGTQHGHSMTRSHSISNNRDITAHYSISHIVKVKSANVVNLCNKIKTALNMNPPNILRNLVNHTSSYFVSQLFVIADRIRKNIGSKNFRNLFTRCY